MRWAVCDKCNSYCAVKARDHQPGSFVYAKDNSLAGPGWVRSACFPDARMRAQWWAEGIWDGTYACLRCLPSFWNHSDDEIHRWLHFKHAGARDHARIQARRLALAQSSGWHHPQQWHRDDTWQQWKPE